MPLSREAVLRRLKNRASRQPPQVSVLASLHEAFEEAEGTEFLGDPMWWKYIDDLDVDRLYIPTSIEFRAFKVMCCEVVFYLFYLFILTLYMLNFRDQSIYDTRQHQLRYWQGCAKIESTTAEVTYPEWYKYYPVGAAMDPNAEPILLPGQTTSTTTSTSSTSSPVPTYSTATMTTGYLDSELAELQSTTYVSKQKEFCAVNNVVDLKSLYYWLDQEFLPLVYRDTSLQVTDSIATLLTTFADNDFDIQYHPPNLGNTGALLGSVRIRQLRVQKNKGCKPSKLISHIFPECNGAFTAESMAMNNFETRKVPSYIKSAFSPQSADATMQIDLHGKYGVYPGGGYVVDLPLYRDEAHTMLADLRKSNWLGEQTRALIIEANVLNVNLNILINNRILFEFLPTGIVVASQEVNSFPIDFLAPGFYADTKQFCEVILLIISGVAIVKGVVWQIRQTGFIRHVTYFYNLVDFLILFLWFFYLVMRILLYAFFASEDNLAADKIGHPELFMPISKAALTTMWVAKTILAFLGLVSWFKLFKYMVISERFRVLTRVIAKSAAELAVFSGVALVLFFAFGLAFFGAYGGSDERFSSIGKSFLILFFYLMGGFQVDVGKWFSAGENSSRAVLLLAYLLCVYFIVLNIFMAIVLDAYTVVAVINAYIPKSEYKAQRRKAAILGPFLRTLYFQSRGISPMGEDEDEGGDGAAGGPGVDMSDLDAEANEIHLADLPGCVAKKWLVKKRQMREAVHRWKPGVDAFKANPTWADEDEEQEGLGMMGSSSMFSPRDLDTADLDYEEMQKLKKQEAGIMGRISNGIRSIRPKIASYFTPQSQQALTQVKKVPEEKDKYNTGLMYSSIGDGSVEVGRITAAQLQKLLDGDTAVRVLLGHALAHDVIRKFKTVNFGYKNKEEDMLNQTFQSNSTGMRTTESKIHNRSKSSSSKGTMNDFEGAPDESYTDAIEQLQTRVFGRLDKLEKGSLKRDIVDIPHIRFLSNQLVEMYQDIQNQWREGVTSVLESATVISEGLLVLTKNLERVSQNHSVVMEALMIDDGDGDRAS